MNPITKADIERLRRRVERIEASRAAPAPPPVPADDRDEACEPDEALDIESCLNGQVIENADGRFFLAERFYPNHRRHGSFEISRLGETPGEWLSAVSRGTIPPCDPRRWAFLDTETTGLSGGSGTCAFLIGVGVIESEGFRVRLYFMRDFDEEAAMLRALGEFLASYDVLITYNGKSYDAPLLETRYRLRRAVSPLDRMDHLDLLHGARSLFKNRLESCRLTKLEYEILGFEREGDLPGAMIPQRYFEYLRARRPSRLAPLFLHNALDIVSLACLTGVVLPAFALPDQAPLRHGADLLGLARWLRRSGAADSAVEVYRQAVQAGMADDETFTALWETALIEKKRGRRERMVEILRDLTAAPNPRRPDACDELAKHLEHVAKDRRAALAVVEIGLDQEPENEVLERRRRRLVKALDRARPAPLF